MHLMMARQHACVLCMLAFCACLCFVHACVLCMPVFCACLCFVHACREANPYVRSQFILALHFEHVALGMISMWWSNISCAEVATDGMPGAESELEVAHMLLGLSEWKVSNAIPPVVTRTSH